MIKVALVGYGYWGPNVAKQLFNNPKIDFAYICDKKRERLEKAKRIYVNAVKYTESFEEIIADKSIQAVAIAVETSAHFTLAKKALEAGKHVYVEKPFTSTVEQAKILKSIAKKEGLIIHVDHIMMYHSHIQYIKDLYDKGDLGEVLYFDASRMNLGQVKSDVNSMWDLTIHDLSIIDYLFSPGLPLHIDVVGQKSINKSEVTTFILLKYENFIANVKANWLSPIKERKLIIAGTKKMLVYDDVSLVEKLKIYDMGLIKTNVDTEYNDYVVKTRQGDIISPDVKNSDALYNSVNHFISCIFEKKESMSDSNQGIRLLQILETAGKLL